MSWHTETVYCPKCNQVHVLKSFIETPILVCPVDYEHDVIVISHEDYLIWQNDKQVLTEKYMTQEEKVARIMNIQFPVMNFKDFKPMTIADTLPSVEPMGESKGSSIGLRTSYITGDDFKKIQEQRKADFRVEMRKRQTEEA